MRASILALVMLGGVALAAPGWKPPAKLGIAARELPAVGTCRVWHPGRPASAQPAVGDCSDAFRTVPAGAWILDRTARSQLRVFVTDATQRGQVRHTLVYDAERGHLLRELPG